MRTRDAQALEPRVSMDHRASDAASDAGSQKPAPGTAFSLSTVDFCELNFDEDRRDAYILITARGHFGWQETLAVSNPWFPPVW